MTAEGASEFSDVASVSDGRVYLNTSALKKFRRQLGMSQMGLADYSVSIKQPISIASIKRAELGKPVIYRTALQLAKLFKVNVSELVIETLFPSQDLTLGDGPTPDEPLKMVGREGEFKYITYLLQETQRCGIGKFIYVRGVAGIGKSRLLQEVRFASQSKGFKDIHCKFNGALSGSGMSALVPLVCGCLGINESEVIDLSACSIQSRLQEYGVNDDTHVYVSSILGLELLPQDMEIFKSLSHDTRSHKMRKAVSKVVQMAARDKHWLVVIDDVHWASEHMLHLLGQLISDTHHAAVAWIMASRYENDPLDSKIKKYLIEQSVNIVEISPLSPQDSRSLASNIQPGLTEDQVVFVEQSRGNPLFLTQLLSSVGTSILPSSFLEIVDFKLSLLNHQDLLAVQMAAAIQQELELTTLRELLGNFEYFPEIPIKLRILRTICENTFLYDHDLVMRGIYDRIDSNTLKNHHEKIADYFEGKNNKLRAIHLIKAQSAKAPAAMLEVIQEKYNEFSFIEALELLDNYNAIDFAPTDAFESLQLEGLLLSAIGRNKEARVVFERALTVAQNVRSQLRVVVELARVMNVLDELESEIALLEAYIPLAKVTNDVFSLGQLLYLQGNLSFPSGDHQTARKFHLAAREVASRANDARTEALSLGGIGESYYAQGCMLSATRIFKECLSVCEQFGLKHVESSNRFMLATTRLYLNETHEALADALDSANLAATVGNLRAEIVSRLTAGWLYTSLGQTSDALFQYDAAMKLVYAIGAKRFEPFLLEGIAKCHFVNGHKEKGLKVIQKAWQLVEEQSLYKFIGPWVLGTRAVFEQDEHLRQQVLDRGMEIIRGGCLAHNHYRFYIAAAEVAILCRNASLAETMANQFEMFTSAESCAWAKHHIDLIRSHVSDLLNPYCERSSQTSAHIQVGRKAGLIGVSPVLHQQHHG